MERRWAWRPQTAPTERFLLFPRYNRAGRHGVPALHLNVAPGRVPLEGDETSGGEEALWLAAFLARRHSAACSLRGAPPLSARQSLHGTVPYPAGRDHCPSAGRPGSPRTASSSARPLRVTAPERARLRYPERFRCCTTPLSSCGSGFGTSPPTVPPAVGQVGRVHTVPTGPWAPGPQTLPGPMQGLRNVSSGARGGCRAGPCRGGCVPADEEQQRLGRVLRCRTLRKPAVRIAGTLCRSLVGARPRAPRTDRALGSRLRLPGATHRRWAQCSLSSRAQRMRQRPAPLGGECRLFALVLGCPGLCHSSPTANGLAPGRSGVGRRPACPDRAYVCSPCLPTPTLTTSGLRMPLHAPQPQSPRGIPPALRAPWGLPLGMSTGWAQRHASLEWTGGGSTWPSARPRDRPPGQGHARAWSPPLRRSVAPREDHQPPHPALSS